MDKIIEKLNTMNMSDEERKKYNRYVTRLSDEASYAETLKIEAEERIIRAEMLKVIARCLKNGFSKEQIFLIYDDFTTDEIQDLLNQLASNN